MKAVDLIPRIKQLTQDYLLETYTQTHILEVCYEAECAIVTYKPEVNMVIENRLTVVGTVQTLPANSLKLVDVFNNMGVGGNTPGRSIKKIAREEIDKINPNWHAQAASIEAEHYIYDPMIPKIFLVYPPANAQYIRICTVKEIPPYNFTSPTSEAAIDLTVTTDYVPQLTNYIVGKLMLRNSDRSPNYQRGAYFMSQFYQQMGVKDLADQYLSEANDGKKAAK